MHTIKINRALKLASIGSSQGSAMHMIDLIPEAVIAALPSHKLAAMMDAMWVACLASKAIANREAIDEGAVWDARRERLIELAA